MKRKYLSILCVLLAFLLVLAGCGSGSGGSTASTGGDEAGDGEWKWERKVTIVPCSPCSRISWASPLRS